MASDFLFDFFFSFERRLLGFFFLLFFFLSVEVALDEAELSEATAGEATISFAVRTPRVGSSFDVGSSAVFTFSDGF